MLQLVKKHLEPGGVFIFTTPNLTGYGARMMKEQWLGYREDHVSLKGYDDWVALLKETGFTPVYCGSTFFSGIPWFNRFPLGIVNWGLLFLFGSWKWRSGESFVGLFKKDSLQQ